MKPDRWLIGVVGVLLLVVCLPNPRRAPTANLSPSSYNPDRDGLRALFVALQAQGAPVDQWQEDYTKLEGHGRMMLLCRHPSTRVAELSSAETDLLLRWVESGNTLILSGDYTRSSDGRRLLDELGFVQTESRESWLEKARPSSDKPDALVLIPTEHLPPLFQPQTLLMDYAPPLPAHRKMEAWWKNSEGIYAGCLTRGHGRVILCSSASWLNHEWLNETANLEFLVWILAPHNRWPTTIWFEEAHQGYRTGYVAAELWRERGVRLAALELVGAFLLMLAGLTWRYGPFRSLRSKREQGSLDYVESMAGLYRRGGLHTELAEGLWQETRTAVLHRFRLPSNASDENLDTLIRNTFPQLPGWNPLANSLSLGKTNKLRLSQLQELVLLHRYFHRSKAGV